ncbi:MAG: hypothetical protein LBQ46_03050 [Treponema sp.]|jgi:hypothetical protein|nr:hypothetical protein [Treponema sp.]
MKRVVKIIGFLLIFIGAYWYVDGVLQNKVDASIPVLRKFYRLKKNTIDVLILGSSRAYCDVNPALIWRERGILSYHLSTSVQPFWISYYNLLEGLNYQKPGVVILETAASGWGMEYQDFPRAYISTHGLRFSKNKLKAVRSTIPPEYFWDILVGFPLFHSRRDITKNDFVGEFDNRVYQNGYLGFANAAAFETPAVDAIEDALPIPDKQMAYLIKILDLAKEREIPLLLFASPFVISDDAQRYFNTVKRIAAEYHVQFINYNLLYGELGLNFEEDMADTSHLNIRGGVKLSRHLADILAGDYGLPDRRQDPAYAQWNDWAEDVMAELASLAGG